MTETTITAPAARRVADPLRLATELFAAAEQPALLYERAGTWTLASGAVREVVLTARGLTVRAADGTRRTEPVGDQPLQQVAAAVAGLTAYGWIGFDLSFLLHGLPVPQTDEPLLHLFVPEREVMISEGADPGDGIAARSMPAPVAVDTVEPGGEYRRAVAGAVADIRARRLQKVILSRVVEIGHDVDLPATYETGRRANTPARSFLLDVGGLRSAGFSPETVVEVGADGRVSTQPLAGTRAFFGDAAVDAGLRADLLDDSKEIFEHAISVRLACDELRQVCAAGTVRVDDFMDVAERGSVQHLASRVSGRLADGNNGWHALAALFPAITASGVPKAAACATIRRYERQPRGLYSGAVLTVGADGSIDAALVLRSIFQQAGRTWLRAGAGIVDQSTPDREFEETCEKLRSISRFVVPA
ncbi:salicylate synthase [Actinoplanes sp. L3-i22]|uniref:salicylate synthase n=1 Tax=Actinoplanes sp. L3-i22 TaxID=2836373 RepID=UPI001C75C164|nr:salicylate synthase [Actinoplanes sp. L3-i22]BCY11524.1 salicylate synthase [Actinoplanes sp. L3-i22]